MAALVSMLKLQQRQVAEQIGVDKTSIYNWETNRTKPGLEHMPAIIHFLGYNPLPPPGGSPDRLVQHRTALGLSQKKAADRIGVGTGREEANGGVRGSRIALFGSHRRGATSKLRELRNGRPGDSKADSTVPPCWGGCTYGTRSVEYNFKIMKTDNDDTAQWLLSLLSIAVAGGLAIVRIYAIPEHPTSAQHLLSDLIPEAIVALLAVPIVYTVLYRRGISVEHRLIEAIAQVQLGPTRQEATSNISDAPLDPFKKRFFHYHLTNDADGRPMWLCKVLDFRNSRSGDGMLDTTVTVQPRAGEAHQYTFTASVVGGQHLMLTAERKDKDHRPAVEVFPFWAGQADVHCSVRANVDWSDSKLLSIGILSERKIGSFDEGPVANEADMDQLLALWRSRMKEYSVFIPTAKSVTHPTTNP